MSTFSQSPEVSALLERCARLKLTTWETEFIASMRELRRPPTVNQLATINEIAKGKPDFAAINNAALASLADILERWLPDGETLGHEFNALNPRRGDTHAGSFKVNLRTGKWSDFATGDRGGDPVSLAAYLFQLKQVDAARNLATMLGMDGANV